MYEDLLGYLLGELNAVERRQMEDALAADPQLRLRYERLRRTLEPLDSLAGDHDPPPGLVDRTMHALDQHADACRPTPRRVDPSRPKSMAPWRGDAAVEQPSFYSISDGIVLALVGLAAITLFLPALANSRYTARKEACQNNLRLIGSLLLDDSLRHGAVFVEIPTTGNQAFAGRFASTMIDRHLLPADTSALHCPGVERRGDVPRTRVPTLAQIDAASGTELDRLQQMAGGDYAYAVGYRDDHGQYVPIRNLNRPYFPILADGPSLHLVGRKSANHGGRGQNIFYEDGHVAFVTELKRFVGDDPWRNRQGHAEAGDGRDDAVLLRSGWPPLVPSAEDDSSALPQPLR